MNIEKRNYPIKAVQFGEGNFLRGFVDYMIDILNEKKRWDGSVTLLQPIEFGSLDHFKTQNCLYTVFLRGLESGTEKIEKRVITCCNEAVSCIKDYERYAALAKLDTLRFVISNTTEAGIVYDGSCLLSDRPPKSYPAKLAKFLYERYTYFNGDINKGIIVLPVELIDDNGIELKRIVKLHVYDWKLGDEFESWLDRACVFASTLVDRIVTGYPKEEAEVFAELGYEDKLLVTGEPFALWVIEADRDISDEIPFDKAGLPVIFTDNQKPYKQRKVRILNGAHTSFVLASFLAGNDFVGQSMDDELIFKFMRDTIFDEVIPTLDLPKEDLIEFANAVIDRFKNPFIKHALLSISLNSISKWRARCLPSLMVYLERKGELPAHLTFSLAANIAFYNGNEIKDGILIGNRNGEPYNIQDDKAVLEFFAKNSSLSSREIAELFLGNEEFFGEDLNRLPGLTDKVTDCLSEIRSNGMRTALEKYFK
ncbi:MAG: tagaturonate reductase [Eubacterium sp.]|jgi:tagaturonate reductase|nr:tagaturonate reductase [Eubacterium sp.]